jgi:adenylate cyclase
MAFTLNQTVYLVLLLFVFYGCLKSLLVYKQRREFKYLAILAFFIIISPHLWMKAYGIRIQEFLVTFQFVITLIPLALFLFYDYWERKRLEEQKDKIRIKTFFERYVNPKIINQLLKQGRLELKGKRQTVTVFFMDIRGFTKLSEKMSAEEVIKILNHYFDISTSIIFKYDGTVDKFMGDCVMALFNAPTAVKDHELKAVEAAFEIQKELRKGGKVDSGVGIHSGEAIVGNIGSKHKMDYTAIGDTVNTASRLEGQTKAGEIAVSKSVYEKIKHKYPTKHKEKVKVKGKEKSLEIYRYKTR